MRPPLALLLIALAAGLAGCTHDVEWERGRVVSIVQRDYRFKPQDIAVAPGRLTFRVRNASQGPHNFVIRTKRGVERGRITTLQPGESGKVTVRLTRGDYVMFCSIGHHEVLGEHGTISVR